ncbi:RNA 2',3'-cyclic phosphodiesterase [Candidatus Parcubacteria bacterium]|nr:RNA 2',3'-cyclic phosphodiesterase [Candidatus Parcubacteria bacterium]
MKHRIFIAVNLPEDVRQALLDEQKEIPRDLPVKLAKQDNLHITLCFLGYIEEEQISRICEIVKDIAEKHIAFSVNLDKISYGPPDIMPPRMIWALGALNKELSEINKELERELLGKKNVRDFVPHITLGRIKEWQWRRIEPEERPAIEKDISLEFEVKTIDIMESRLKRSGAEYTILQSFPL